jgi:CheY-like chemotaxis protein/HPt (histidine-containing phosphotransfer) domain-containing protein
MTEPLRILVIDDDPVMRELLETLLGISGHLVETVDSGEAALARLALHGEQAHFGLVLTDLHMPGIQGAELAARLQAARAPGTLLIGMSGSFPTEAEKKLLDYFLQKPFTIPQFEAALQRVQAQAHGAASAPGAATASSIASAVAPITLDEEVFARLAAVIPAQQLRELYALSLDDIAGRVVQMRAALAADDLAAARAQAHAIKGGSGMVGASELYALAAQAETGSDAGSMHLDDFAPACARLRRMLDARLQTDE